MHFYKTELFAWDGSLTIDSTFDVRLEDDDSATYTTLSDAVIAGVSKNYWLNNERIIILIL